MNREVKKLYFYIKAIFRMFKNNFRRHKEKMCTPFILHINEVKTCMKSYSTLDLGMSS